MPIRRTPRSALFASALLLAVTSCEPPPAASESDEYLDPGTGESTSGLACNGLDACSGDGAVFTSVIRVGESATSRAEVVQHFTATSNGLPATVTLRLRPLRPFTSPTTPVLKVAVYAPPQVADADLDDETALLQGAVDIQALPSAPISLPLAGGGALVSGNPYLLRIWTEGFDAAGGAGSVLVGVATLADTTYAGGELWRQTQRRVLPESWRPARARPMAGADVAFAFAGTLGSPCASPQACSSGVCTGGVCVSGTTLTASPSSVTFPTTFVGATASALAVTLTNVSSSTLSLSSLTSSDAVRFPLTHTCTAPLAPSATCTASVTFVPTAVGSFSATLSLVPSTGAAVSVSLGGLAETPVCPSAPFVFDYVNGLQTLPVPPGCDTVTIKAWGSAGGRRNYPGGAGGYVTGKYAVVAGETLDIVVGQGGQVRSAGTTASANYPAGYMPGGLGGVASGGGLVGVRKAPSTWLVVAGSGGGGDSGGTISYREAGAGGGTTGGTGQNLGGTPALGGTQSAGGQVFPRGTGVSTPAGADGGFLTGGLACGDSSVGVAADCAGGGAGWYGGAGASWVGSGCGGGGSSYFATTPGLYLAGGATLGGSVMTPGNATDPERGTAGAVNGVNEPGNPGRVVLRFSGPVTSPLMALVTPSTLALPWGTQTVDTASTRTIAITNAGGPNALPLTVTASALTAPFSLTSNDCAAVVGDASCAIVVTFSAATLGSFPASLTLTPNEGSPATVALSAATSTAVCPGTTHTFNYNGSLQTLAVPAGCNAVSVKAWGGAGGRRNYPAGAGGYVTGQYVVVPGGETLNIVVGQGGQVRASGATAAENYPAGYMPGGLGGAASGGGLVGVRKGADTWLVVAGSGGGGYDGGTANRAAGAGGGLTGGTGVNADVPQALGGSQTAGGQVTPRPAGASVPAGADGGFLTGGIGCADQNGTGYYSDCAGGGAGWYGGAGASYWGSGGGGGGSSYFATTGGLYLSGGATMAGSGTTPGNAADPDRGSAGTAPATTNTAGNPGRVVLRFLP